MDQAERWPVDFDAIGKGDVISQGRLAAILGERPGTYAYQFKLARFQAELERALWDRGHQLTVAHVGGELRILDDVTASAHNAKRFRQTTRRLARQHRRMLAVDVRQLSEADRHKHDRDLIVQGAVLAGMIDGRRAGLRVAHRRNTPGLPAPEGQIQGA